MSRRPAGCVSIPIEIISASNSSVYPRHNSPLSTFRNNNPYSDFSNSSSSWKKPTINSYLPRQNPPTAYDRSNEDLLSSSFIDTQSQNNKFRSHSDFLHPNEYRVPIKPHTPQGTLNSSHDRSRSPASQRSESPTRPPPPPSAASQQQESDFKISADATGSSTATSSNDQQVPSTEISPPIPVRDPNVVALEKLEQIKQNLENLNQQVELFTGSTRDDRIYKELDEQALKIMLRCDELIDVSVDIKEKRKDMIRNVQTVLAKLESKVPINSLIQSNSNLVIYDPSIMNTEQQKDETSSIEQST